MAEKEKFIQSATKNSHGQFRAKAEAAGKSTKEFAEEHKDSPGRLGKQARLALTLMGMKHGPTEKKKSRNNSETRKKLYGKED